MFGKFLVIFGSLAVARAGVLRAAPAVLAKIEDFDPAPQYSFAYDVQDSITGDSKAQYETRNGDLVQGSYSLIEADGTRRIVDYTADSVNGFNAIVSREPAIAVAPVAAKTAVVPAVARAAIVAAPRVIPARAAYFAQYPAPAVVSAPAKTAIIPAATAPFVAAPGVISARAAYVPHYSAPAVARLAAPLTYAAAGYAI